MVDSIAALIRADNIAVEQRREINRALRLNSQAIQRQLDDAFFRNNPADFIREQNLQDDIQNLAEEKDEIQQDLNRFLEQQSFLDALERTAEIAESLIEAARIASDRQIQDIAEQFNQVREQLAALADEANQRGAENVNRDFIIERLGDADDFNNFASPQDIFQASQDTDELVRDIQNEQQLLASDISAELIQDDLNDRLTDTFQRDLDDARVDELAEEAATQATLQARDELAAQTQQISEDSRAYLETLLDSGTF